MSTERTPSERPSSSEGVRAFKRGLDVLHEVNRSGGIRAGDIARQLDLPRPTVYLLLETVEELGYVVRSASDDRFRVTRRASSVGDGYDPGVVMCQAAAPYLAELSKNLVWPVDLSTCENGVMIIQETTHSRSPLSIDRGMIGKRLPMLRTSACSSAPRGAPRANSAASAACAQGRARRSHSGTKPARFPVRTEITPKDGISEPLRASHTREKKLSFLPS